MNKLMPWILALLGATIPLAILGYSWYTNQALDETPFEMLLVLLLFLWIGIMMSVGCGACFYALWPLWRRKSFQKILHAPNSEEILQTKSQRELNMISEFLSLQLNFSKKKAFEKASEQERREKATNQILTGLDLIKKQNEKLNSMH